MRETANGLEAQDKSLRARALIPNRPNKPYKWHVQRKYQRTDQKQESKEMSQKTTVSNILDSSLFGKICFCTLNNFLEKSKKVVC